MVFLLVHSPLVGPRTWAAVAGELEARGHSVLVPSLVDVPSAPPPQWRHAIANVVRAAAEVEEAMTIVGHSNAGLLLPELSVSLASGVAQLVFVDSLVPPLRGDIPVADEEFLATLRSRASGGWLPPWSAWWGDDGMNELVPDPAVRTALVEEMQPLPLSYFEQRIPSPEGWARVPCAYILFSAFYRGAAATAAARGWTVRTVPSATHLQMAVTPSVVADLLTSL